MSKSVINIPAHAVVLLIGPAGAGKSTFAARHFPREAILSPDSYRKKLGEATSQQQHNSAVFERTHRVLEERAAAGLLTVIDATNTRGPERTELNWHAHRHRRPLIAIALHLPLEVCLTQNRRREDPVPARVIRQHAAHLRHLETDLELEGYLAVHLLRTPGERDAAEVIIDR